MEKALIRKIEKFVPEALDVSKQKSPIWVDYDKGADVLYISFEKPQRASDSETLENGIILRKRGNKTVGITILHASKFRKK